MKDKLLNVLKVAISLGLVVFIFTRPEIRNVDWATVLAELRFWPWLLGLAIYFIAIGFNVLKWQYLLRTLDLHVPFPSLYRYNLVGLFFALLPLSMVGGDIARGWDLARHTEGQAAEVAVSVLVDRLVGLAGFLLASVLGLAAAVLVLGRPELGWLLATLGAVLLGFVLALAALISQRLRGLVERLFNLGPLKRFLSLYQRLSDSVQGYRNHLGALFVALGIQLLTVLTTCVVNYLAAVATGTDAPLAWVFVLTPLTAFAPFLPSIASGLGWNQGAFYVLYV
ncbi:MAG: lysylphosphatidylglycerol synthase transmembrane domain-containing protein, partial [Anaerolineae bacterium]